MSQCMKKVRWDSDDAGKLIGKEVAVTRLRDQSTGDLKIQLAYGGVLM